MKVVIEDRPDTTALEEAERRWYADPDHLRFRECDACRAKTGTPTMCEPCYQNRLVIAKLRERLAKHDSRFRR